MRKLLPMVLLAATLLPFLAPLLAWGQNADAGLPACCRRNGQHHCAMSMAEKSQLASNNHQGPQWRAPLDRCPFCPATVASWHHGETLAAPIAQAIFAELIRHPAGSAQTECRRRIARDRSHQQRGPPPPVSA